MKEPTRYVLAGLVGWGLAASLPAQEPNRLDVGSSGSLYAPRQNINQQMAESIAERLKQSGQLHRYRIDIVFQDGIAALTGEVTDQPQHEEVLRLVQGMPGVEQVRDQIRVRTAMPIEPAQAMAPPPTPLPGNNPPAAGAGAPNFQEPMPIAAAPAMGPYALNKPKMPPYAWPTYAPYNNFSRVAYPNLYPYNAWPFIGPIYPFPKVPLGWRTVQLEWKDGWWWYSKHSNSHDWWRLRYW